MAKKVTPIAYSVDDTLRMDLVDDNGFSAEGVSFVVFSSSELPKNQKCYFEIIVTENPKREVCRFNLKENGSTVTSVIFAELYKQSGEWQFKAIGEGKIADLNGILGLYM